MAREISSPLGASGSAQLRIRCPGLAAATSMSAAMLAAAAGWSTPAPRCARRTTGRPSSTRLTNPHSRGCRVPGPWILDGRSTLTGRLLSSSCSAATLFAP